MSVPPGLPIRIRCGCGPNSIPLRITALAVVELGRLLAAAGADPGFVVLTYRCRHCHEIATITAADLHLSTPDPRLSAGA